MTCGFVLVFLLQHTRLQCNIIRLRFSNEKLRQRAFCEFSTWTGFSKHGPSFSSSVRNYRACHHIHSNTPATNCLGLASPLSETARSLKAGDPGSRPATSSRHLSLQGKSGNHTLSQLSLNFTGLRSHLYVLWAFKVWLFREVVAFSLERAMPNQTNTSNTNKLYLWRMCVCFLCCIHLRGRALGNHDRLLGNQEGPIIRHCPGFSAD